MLGPAFGPVLARVLVASAASAAWLAAPGDALAPASRTAVVALLWCAALGLPCARAGARERTRQRADGDARPGAQAAFAAAAAAPFLGLSLALERGAGSVRLDLAARGIVALVLCALGALAARRARGDGGYALAWTAFVAGLPACAALFAWTTGGVAPWLAVAATWSPLGWLVAWSAGAPAAPWGALAASIALVAWTGRRAGTPDGRGGAASVASRAACLVPLAALSPVPGAAAPVARAPFEVGRAALVELALEGPLEACTLLTEHGTTRVRAGLARGETRRVLVPVAGAALAEPRLVLAPEDERRGAARIVALRGEAPAASGSALARRALPPLADGTRAGADGAALAALAAAVLATVALRRRSGVALAVGLGSGALLFAFGAAGRAAPPPVAIHEGEHDAWLAVHVARDGLALEPASALWLAVEPAASALDFEVDLGPPERWTALAPGARLVRRSAWSPPDERWRGATPGADLGAGLGPVVHGWRRTSDGLWIPLAPPRGDPDGARGRPPEGGAPPGWLAAGLPQGLDALVLELAPAPAPGGERWLRWVGSFEKR